MAEAIEMPKLSDTMEEGVVVAWHVKEGDTVKAGDVIAEIETDKATMELESYFDGTLLKIAIGEGDTVPIGSLIAVIGKEGEDISAILDNAKKSSNGQAEAPKEEKAESSAPESTPQPEVSTSTAASSSAPATSNDGRIKASPLAKAMAEERGIDLNQVTGSGPEGRIIKKDIEHFQPSAQPQVSMAPSQVPGAEHFGGEDAFEEVKLSQMRKTIARRLSESKYSAPHFYLTISINMGEASAFRQRLKDSDIKVSFNDLVIKAAAMSLRKHPKVNASWLGDKIRHYSVVNMGVAVAVDEGLMVPVVRNAHIKGLEEINNDVRVLAEKARERKLQPDEMQGNTFTISNLGMFGIDEFTAIINPPDACIMAVGGINDTVIVEDGELAVAKMMKVTLSCDHRVVDGATGAQFLQTFKAMLEQPMKMLV